MSGPSAGILQIVNYHYCQPASNGVFSGVKGVRPTQFAWQAAAMKRDFHPVGPSVLDEGSFDDRMILVTVDDGTRDIYEHALPILRAHGIPAILFCCSQPLEEGRVLDVQKIHLLQARWGLNRFRRAFMAAVKDEEPNPSLEDPARLGLDRLYRYDDPETRDFKILLNVQLPYSVLRPVLDRLFEAEFGDQSEVVRHIYMSRDEILRARDMGFTIGLHTHSHAMLSRLDRSEQELEIARCASFFETILGSPVPMLSYPFGISGTFDQTTKEVLRSNGMVWAFTLGRRSVTRSDIADPFEVPRFDVNDVFGGHAGTDDVAWAVAEPGSKSTLSKSVDR